MAPLKGFGKRLKESVKHSSYTQKQLSEILGINQDTFSNYVKEVYYPKADTLYDLGNLLDVSLDFLVSGEGTARSRNENPLIASDFSNINTYEKELLYNYRLLSERNQGRVDQYVFSLADEE
ncbi:MAG: hypothetical protein APF84_09975 [Gracilibacter sp. BRH_c7a]|nr:MAG: hypothetical protein APF84_09975 [Gracilibacter sp. BRH_c7a]